MPALAGQRIFTVGGMSLAWEDLVLAGCLWGDWPDLETRVRDGLACLARLDDLDDADADALSEDDVEAAAAEFRYARDLVAATDLESWLERRGLTVEAWLDFVRRTLLRERWADEIEAIRDEYEIDAGDVAEALECEAVCGGLAADLAARLAARAAIHARDEAGAADALLREAEAMAATVPEHVLTRVLPHVPAPVRRERLRALARLEVAWSRFVGSAVSPEALRALIAGRRLDWLRVGVQTVVAPDEDVAREIVLCVRLDRRPLAEVAGDAGLSRPSCGWRTWTGCCGTSSSAPSPASCSARSRARTGISSWRWATSGCPRRTIPPCGPAPSAPCWPARSTAKWPTG
jgi:hypothetical protein